MKDENSNTIMYRNKNNGNIVSIVSTETVGIPPCDTKVYILSNGDRWGKGEFDENFLELWDEHGYREELQSYQDTVDEASWRGQI